MGLHNPFGVGIVMQVSWHILQSNGSFWTNCRIAIIANNWLYIDGGDIAYRANNVSGGWDRGRSRKETPQQTTTDAGAEPHREYHIGNRFVEGLDQFHFKYCPNNEATRCNSTPRRISVV